MQLNFSDYINDAIRILVLLNGTQKHKSLKMTENKIKLYDYYLKFPHTMMKDFSPQHTDRENFDEYYAFFHWQPDLIRYRQSINYLISKGFVEKSTVDKSAFFQITDLGIEALNSIDNPYKSKLIDLTEACIPHIQKLSDSKIEESIRKKTNIFSRKGGLTDETKNAD